MISAPPAVAVHLEVKGAFACRERFPSTNTATALSAFPSRPNCLLANPESSRFLSQFLTFHTVARRGRNEEPFSADGGASVRILA
jgi:hypothetical protein